MTISRPLEDWERRLIAAHRNLEYRYARPHLKYDHYPTERALRKDVRHVLTSYLNADERRQLREAKRDARRAITPEPLSPL